MSFSRAPRQAIQLIELLDSRGALYSADIQRALGLSQPTVSRLLISLTDDLVVLGQGRATRYALARPIGARASQQWVWLTDEAGVSHRLATLSFLARSQVFLAADRACVLFEPTAQWPLPWLLSSMRAQGFLGRLLAQRLAGQGLSPQPEQWDTHAVLLAALHTQDVPGALWLGETIQADGHQASRFHGAAPGAELDVVATDVAKTLPIGSSAGGEQPKFTAVNEWGESWLVKFSPPRGTPFGERWNDLLVAEALCSEVLSDFGHQVAETRIVQTAARTYLLSRRFDRVGSQGRRHVVSMGAAHAGFVNRSYQNWGDTAQALVHQRKLAVADAHLLDERLQFGRLVGNTDMHSGNASLWVAGHTLKDMLKGRFALAPVYDMLPMRWKPDPMWGLPDYQPFDAEVAGVSSKLVCAALQFWRGLSVDERVSASLRTVAAAMAASLNA